MLLILGGSTGLDRSFADLRHHHFIRFSVRSWRGSTESHNLDFTILLLIDENFSARTVQPCDTIDNCSLNLLNERTFNREAELLLHTLRSMSLMVFTTTFDEFSTFILIGIDCPGTYPRTGSEKFTVKGGEPQHKQQNVLLISCRTDSWKYNSTIHHYSYCGNKNTFQFNAQQTRLIIIGAI